MRFKSKKCKKRQKFDSLYLFSLHITFVKKISTQMCHRYSSVFLTQNGHGMNVVNFNGFSVMCQKKLSVSRMTL